MRLFTNNSNNDGTALGSGTNKQRRHVRQLNGDGVSSSMKEKERGKILSNADTKLLKKIQ